MKGTYFLKQFIHVCLQNFMSLQYGNELYLINCFWLYNIREEIIKFGIFDVEENLLFFQNIRDVYFCAIFCV